MINKIIHFSVYRKWIVLTVTLVMAIAGFISFQNLPIDAVPDITNNQVQINTVIEGLTTTPRGRKARKLQNENGAADVTPKGK